MIPGPLRRFLQRRRFPTLMLIAGMLFLLNVFIPDPLPFVDELLLLIATLALGSLRGRRKTDQASNSDSASEIRSRPRSKSS